MAYASILGVDIFARPPIVSKPKIWKKSVDRSVAETPLQACSRVAAASGWTVVGVDAWGCTTTTEYGNYCGFNRAASSRDCETPFIPLIFTIDPRPIDGLDACCFLHDCCVGTFIEWIDECHHRECNQQFVSCLIKADCSQSPDPTECNEFRIRAIWLVAISSGTGTPLP